MSFTKNSHQIYLLYQNLKTLQQTSAIILHLCNTLFYVHKNCHEFEIDISVDSPFYEEFFRCLQSTDPDNCFHLLECLIVFCRERQLQKSKEGKISDYELNLLNFYEHSFHWHENDESLLHQWYSTLLPNKYLL